VRAGERGGGSKMIIMLLRERRGGEKEEGRKGWRGETGEGQRWQAAAILRWLLINSTDLFITVVGAHT
jgi:hypothetical protein